MSVVAEVAHHNCVGRRQLKRGAEFFCAGLEQRVAAGNFHVVMTRLHYFLHHLLDELHAIEHVLCGALLYGSKLFCRCCGDCLGHGHPPMRPMSAGSMRTHR